MDTTRGAWRRWLGVFCATFFGLGALLFDLLSEEEAREGEKKEVPPELKAQMEEMDALSIGVPEFFDLKDPWLHSAT